MVKSTPYSVTCLAILPLMVLLLAFPVQADWPRFHGPEGLGRADGLPVPTRWSAEENIAWKTPLPGRGASSPVVFGNRIYLTSFTGYGQDRQRPGDMQAMKLHLLCFDRATGKPLWDKSVPASSNEQRMKGQVAGHGYASATPAVDRTGIHVNFGVSGVVAYDHEGMQRWHVTLGEETRGFGSASSPVLYRDLVYVNASIESGQLVALAQETGDTVWTLEDVERAWSAPALGESAQGAMELVISYREEIKGLDPLTGKALWRCDGVTDYVVSTPIIHEGVAYCLGGRANQAIALRLGGRGDVTKTHRLWHVDVGANLSTPVMHEGRLHWVNDRGYANAIDAVTGKAIYRERLNVSGRVYASTVIANGHLYIPTLKSGTLVLDAGAQFRLVSQNRIESDEDPFMATPAVDGGQLFLRSDGFLYCIGML